MAIHNDRGLEVLEPLGSALQKSNDNVGVYGPNVNLLESRSGVSPRDAEALEKRCEMGPGDEAACGMNRPRGFESNMDRCGSDVSCPYLPGFGPCENVHVHRKVANLNSGPNGRVLEEESTDSISMSDDADRNECPTSVFSPLREARTVIRVCEEGGLRFRESEKKLIELKLADVVEKVGEKSYDLRPRRNKGETAKGDLMSRLVKPGTLITGENLVSR
ncbi:hypothetical protein PIB30_012176 [Stylosanthes scabra]|uniref:Uncharacterized protein n=1 Tax=Stylosanthes scabra TaxID=79078 RepID=A0ABU6T6F9_9FABA|nr:hypothetical protein [Stylosanthes scabra]